MKKNFEMVKYLICVETGKKTKINLSTNDPWTNDDILDAAANRLLRREPEYKHDFVTISVDNMSSEICHALTDLTEHTGEYLTFKLMKSKTLKYISGGRQ